MKIMYIHGLGSGSNSSLANKLRELLKDDVVFSPEIPINPKEAMESIYNNFREFKPDVVIGSSLGGFYTMQLGGCVKILINPAMFADEDIENAIGYGRFLYTSDRKDGATSYIIDRKFILELKKMKNTFFKYGLDEGNIIETYALFGTHDELFSHYTDFIKYFLKCKTKLIDSGHHITDKAIENNLIPLINSVRGGI